MSSISDVSAAGVSQQVTVTTMSRSPLSTLFSVKTGMELAEAFSFALSHVGLRGSSDLLCGGFG